MANPVFTNNPAFQQGGTIQSPPQTLDPTAVTPVGFDQNPGVMSYEGTLTKAGVFFVVTVLAAIAAAMLAPQLANIFGIAAFGMSLVVAFSRSTNPVLLGLTLALMGAAAGSISYVYEVVYGLDGIITQSLIGVATVAGVCLWLYRSGRVRVTARSRKYLQVAVISFVSYSIVIFALSFFGIFPEAVTIPGTSIPWGALVGVLGILIGSWMLITDFDTVEQGVRNAAPVKYEWLAAYGLVFSVIWLYMQILRVLRFMRR